MQGESQTPEKNVLQPKANAKQTANNQKGAQTAKQYSKANLASPKQRCQRTTKNSQKFSVFKNKNEPIKF